MKKTTVMLLFGGESSEHEVSVSSARNVFAALDDTKYDVVLCYIDRNGRWWLIENMTDPVDISTASQLLPELGGGCFVTLPNKEAVFPDVILPILHGVNGEDGTVQGLAKLTHIPIVGCKVEASAVTMDKVTTKQLLEHNNIQTVPFEVHIAGDALQSFHQLSDRLGSPLFIKPANGGSSVGISKASNDDELSTALNDAHKHDDKVLIETAITARELEVAVLGSGKSAKVSGIGEIKPDREFYDYDSKYDNSSQTQAIIPADIPSELAESIKKTTASAYQVLGCTGLARVDFFLSETNEVYLNEVNTLPGFTNISMYPKLWRQEGLSYAGLIDALIADALEK